MIYRVDLTDVTTKQQFHERVQDGIPCPEYYGKNLDALYDVLMELSGSVEVVFEHFQEFSHQMPGYAEAVEHMCEDVAAEMLELTICLE